MKESPRYAKIVEWSEDDQCYVGSCPGLFYGGCHGENEQVVFDELCQIVEEMIGIYRQDNRTLPPRLRAGIMRTCCKPRHKAEPTSAQPRNPNAWNSIFLYP